MKTWPRTSSCRWLRADRCGFVLLFLRVWLNVSAVEPPTSSSSLCFVSLPALSSFLPAQRSSGIFLFSPPFHCNTPSFSSSHWVSSLCCQLISLGGSFVSVTLFSHCGLCLCLPISLSLSACVHGLLLFLFASFLYCDSWLFFFAGRYPFYLQFVFVQLAHLFYFIAHPLLSPPPISLFSYRLCSVWTSSSYLSILSPPFLHHAQPSLTRLCLNRIPPFSSSFLSINTWSLISSLHRIPPPFLLPAIFLLLSLCLYSWCQFPILFPISLFR